MALLAVQCLMKNTLNFLGLTVLCALAVTILLTGCASQEEAKQEPMRQRFVPASGDSSSLRGANWTALHRFPDDESGVLTVMAHAGVGDTFPIHEEGKPKVFDVTVIAGDDDHLVLEVHSEEASQRLDVSRDGTGWVEVNGYKYSVAYPSVTVSPDSKPTTDKAMILVHRFP
jgi:hypothetical protein